MTPSPSRTQIFLASTLYGVATLAAALDSDRFEPAGRRVLLVSNNASVPETTLPADGMPGFEALRDRFDKVRSWNETIFPFHPGGWSPRPDDVPLWERYLRQLWDLGDDEIELVVESIQVEPALALVQLFPDAAIHVYADGLMSYGPTRNKLDLLVTTRIRTLLHLDLVPGLTPLLLSEHGVPRQIVPTGAFTAVLAQLAAADAEPDPASEPGSEPEPKPEPASGSRSGEARRDRPAAQQGSGPALLLGQYLAALGILTAEEEERLHLRMLRGAVARGHRRIVFKPHPTAPARWSRSLEREAAGLGVELTVHDTPTLAEVLFQRLRPALVVGCFSTALITASVFYGIPVARTGTDLLLRRLTPFQNSNRVPVTLADVLLPPLEEPDPGPGEPYAVAELNALLRALGYCMQHRAYPRLREAALSYLAGHPGSGTKRYFSRRRLASLGLPGAFPARIAFLTRDPRVRRVARRVLRVARSRSTRRQRLEKRRAMPRAD